MLMGTDPLRELEQFVRRVLGTSGGGWSSSLAMPVDAYRAGDDLVVCLDLPGVDLGSVELHVERHVLTVKAERRPAALGEGVQMELAERPMGRFSRQLYLGDALDTEHVTARCSGGVLTLRIPIICAPANPPQRLTLVQPVDGPDGIDPVADDSGKPAHAVDDQRTTF